MTGRKEQGRSSRGFLTGVASSVVKGHRGKRIYQMNNSGWKTAWEKAVLPIDGSNTKGPHNLIHTFGRRLRSA